MQILSKYKMSESWEKTKYFLLSLALYFTFWHILIKISLEDSLRCFLVC